MRNKKLIPMMISMAMITSLLSGCNLRANNKMFSGYKKLDNSQIIRIEDNICEIEEAKVILMNITNQYKKDFGGSISTDIIVGGKKFNTYVKDKVKEEISIVYTLSQLAVKNNIEISEEEMNNIKIAAENYYGGLSDGEKSYLKIEKDDIEQVYTNYYKADKYIEQKVSGVTDEISDEDARVIKVQYIQMSSGGEENPTDILKQVKKQVENGYQDFIVQANKYTQIDETEVYLYKNECTKEWQKAAFKLQDNQVSEVVNEDGIYYLVRCVSAYEKAETTKNKAKIVSAQKSGIIKAEYEEFTKDLSKDINSKAWDGIKVPVEENIIASNLFEIYETYVKEQ